MSVREGMHAYLTDRRTLRACLYLAAVLALVLLAVWPRGPLEAALRTGQATDTFTVVAICFLVAALYLGGRFGAEDYSPDPTVQLQELVSMTPVPLLSLAAGRLAFGALHTLVLLLLGAPFLVAAMAVGGVGLPQLVQVLCLVGAASLAARMAGLCMHALAGGRRPVRDIVLFLGVTTAAAAAFFLVPAASAFRVIGALAREPVDAPLLPAVVDVTAAAALAAGALAVLAGVRVRARRRAPGADTHE
jgi:hypothetical protein